MRILLDCRFQRGAGPNLTARYLLDELLRLDGRHRYWILQHAGQDLPEYPGVERIFVPSRVRWGELLWVQLVLPRILKRERIDLYHSLKHFGPLWTRTPTILPIRAVSQFLEGMQELGALDRLYWRNLGSLAWRRASCILAVSGVCRDVLVERVGIPQDRVRVIHHGVDRRFRRLPPGAVPGDRLVKWGLDAPFFLCVGNPYPHKNYVTAVRALHRLRAIAPELRRHKLAIAGDVSYAPDELRAAIRALELDEGVVFTGFLSHDDLVLLYNRAELLWFCSRFEAFPNPVLEAMACGLPVVAAARGAVDEIAAGAVVRVEDPFDAEAFADAARAVLRDPARRAGLVEAGLARAAAFRWERAARAVLEVYAELDARGRA